MSMLCPHCKNEIDDTDVARYLAAKGGAATGKRKARSSTQARAAVKARWDRVKKTKKRNETPPD